jgi:hypothetical protein
MPMAASLAYNDEKRPVSVPSNFIKAPLIYVALYKIKQTCVVLVTSIAVSRTIYINHLCVLVTSTAVSRTIYINHQ